MGGGGGGGEGARAGVAGVAGVHQRTGGRSVDVCGVLIGCPPPL